MRPLLLLLAVLLPACTRRPPVRITTLSEGRTYRERPLAPAKCQQRVRLPTP